ncbi:hypothetical protein L2E82_20189 [Cichorium intybus]|uniref:Uncharacterized protein n=1 Tax=Cichorium intybus TaxID=13427 RepID=A0ACB9DT27_CICIN|nr:hypothetical protein L2E82_20189 [Cichorium intybus]
MLILCNENYNLRVQLNHCLVGMGTMNVPELLTQLDDDQARSVSSDVPSTSPLSALDPAISPSSTSFISSPEAQSISPQLINASHAFLMKLSTNRGL